MLAVGGSVAHAGMDELGIGDAPAALAPELAEGGATRANPLGLGAVYTAPATMALIPRYTVGGGVRLGPSGDHLMQVEAMDSQTGAFALGLAWLRRKRIVEAPTSELPGWMPSGSRDTTSTVRDLVVGGSAAFAPTSRHVSAGFGVFYHGYRSTYADAVGSFNLAASLAARLEGGWIFSLTAQDLLQSQVPGVRALGGIGMRWQPTDGAGIGIDASLPLDGGGGAGLSAGGVYTVEQVLPVRLGMSRTAQGDRYASFGLGLTQRSPPSSGAGGRSSPETRFSIDYVFRYRLGGSSFSDSVWNGLAVRLSL